MDAGLAIGLGLVLLTLMHAEAVMRFSVRIGGIAIQEPFTRTGDVETAADPTLPAARSGKLSTHTSGVAGVATLGADHGLSVGDRIDVYWQGGLAYGATIDETTAQTVTFSGAQGDALPAEDTNIRLAQCQPVDCGFDGDRLRALVAHVPDRSCLIFVEADDSVVAAKELQYGEPLVYIAGFSPGNPFSGPPIARIYASTAATADRKLRIGFVYNCV